jgi:hypothetical protein
MKLEKIDWFLIILIIFLLLLIFFKDLKQVFFIWLLLPIPP